MGDDTHKRVGRYTPVDKLYEGTLGVMWAALAETADGPDRVVAARWLECDAAMARRIAEQVANTQPDAGWPDDSLVVPMLGAAVTDDGVLIASEYVEGETLRALLWRAELKRSAIPAPVALRVALDLLATVEHAQRDADGPKHRSLGLHADNVLVTRAGRACVLELAVCRFAVRTEPWSRDPKWACYRGPEVLSDAPSDGVRADIFAVGVLLWEMLKNRPLFKGLSYDAVVRNVLGARVARLDVGRPTGGDPIDSSIADVVEQALRRSPESRFESAQEMADAIESTGQPIATPTAVAEFLGTVASDSLERMARAVERADAQAAAEDGARREAADKAAARVQIADPSTMELDVQDILDDSRDATPSPPGPPPQRSAAKDVEHGAAADERPPGGVSDRSPPPPPRARGLAGGSKPPSERVQPTEDAPSTTADTADDDGDGDEAPCAPSNRSVDTADRTRDEPPQADDAATVDAATAAGEATVGEQIQLPLERTGLRSSLIATGVVLLGVVVAYFALAESDSPPLPGASTVPSAATVDAPASAAPSETPSATMDQLEAGTDAEAEDAATDADADAADAQADAAPTARPVVQPGQWRRPWREDIYE